MDKQLRLAIEKFNNRKFFDCHDILEDTWFEVSREDKDFYQGLLHFAVAFHHLVDKKNPTGAKLQFKKCIERLKDYDKIYKGINIEMILKAAKESYKKLEAGDTKDIRIPKVKIS
jgi:predicted metal-dependent hydrolase